MGGTGCISVTANVAPRLCADFQAAWAAGDYRQGARRSTTGCIPLHVAMFTDASPGPGQICDDQGAAGLPAGAPSADDVAR